MAVWWSHVHTGEGPKGQAVERQMGLLLAPHRLELNPTAKLRARQPVRVAWPARGEDGFGRQLVSPAHLCRVSLWKEDWQVLDPGS